MKNLLRFLVVWVLLPVVAVCGAPGVEQDSLFGKVVCGYQGWFRCEGDGANNGWHHYAAGGRFEPGVSHIEMWPDVSELPAEERFATPFRFADGGVAEVFSSARAAVVRLHFQWMREYGIDGVLLQRFAASLRDPRFARPMDAVLSHCREAAKQSGRRWALMYDLSGTGAEGLDRVREDWKRLVRAGDFQREEVYLRHRGKPLVALWGLGFSDRAPHLDEWAALLRFFRDDPEFGGCALLLGVPYHWRTLRGDAITDARLQELLTQADILSPWAVGRLATPQDAAGRVETVLKPDQVWCVEKGVDYLPVVFPGFSWHNLSKTRGKEAPVNEIPRREGRFLWEQAAAAVRSGARMVYVAMFDEMDEGTAIFKTTNTPPVGASPFLSEPVPSDHYLWLTGRIGGMLRSGEVQAFPQRSIGR